MTRSVEIPDEARKAASLAIHCRLSVGSPSSWIGGINPPSTDELAHAALVAARPYLMPTREQIAEALHAHEKADPWNDEGCNDDADGAYTSCHDLFLERADVVLALSPSGGSGE